MDYRQDVMLGAFVPALGGYSYNINFNLHIIVALEFQKTTNI